MREPVHLQVQDKRHDCCSSAVTVLANTTTAGTAAYLASGLSSVPAGTVAYNYGGSLSTNSGATTTISGFETYTLSSNGVNAVYLGDGAKP